VGEERKAMGPHPQFAAPISVISRSAVMCEATTDEAVGRMSRKADGWLAQLYHENTKISPARLAEVEARIIAAAEDCDCLCPRPLTEPALPRIRLSRRHGWWGLDRIIRRRRTIRALVARPISLRWLSRILSNANGVTQWHPSLGDAPSWPFRAVPSAGALYSIELRIAALHVPGLERGVYRYHPYDHCLERTDSHLRLEQLAEASLHHDSVRASAAVIALCADCDRLIAKYGDRGYRFALLEAGHIAQNVLLTCTALGLAAVPIGGFLDDECVSVFASHSPPAYLTYLLVIGRARPKARSM
jgi:SagB-type dehydrogenase family enzyme